ncbi:MAG TPA: acyl-CoA dehydrogenase family protein [Marmoricola sp.]|jgi:alkylation response protein AidB-like acyl-CoA dehydrogenase|nr:acyl-CoA/acyl-ACP dehydrogenase [Nocardioidaceae bacterium]MCB8993772.1 acyl-CoA/acyl-ACP dehydrogenase [Nocardioidaceae bacterium]MCO5324696.1 acyl-CoA/acyl-ACP dehydrogenase [Nocardioidaceae bacterium]HMY09495.1 acyl-CoA dehydrogenase family protein [Marmoricola sp.]HRV68820.1 acyl-CoA dehydrogenase family protein [Marmoricola sp.]
MDFTLSTEQTDAAALAAEILKSSCTPELQQQVTRADQGRFSSSLWQTLGEAGLIGLPLPEQHGGAGLGLAEACSVLIEVGRVVAPVPLATHLAAAMAIAEFGTTAQKDLILGDASSGQTILTCAIPEELDEAPHAPSMRATRQDDGWVISGTKTNVIAATHADWFVVPANTPEGIALFLLPVSELPSVTAQHVSDGDIVGELHLDSVPVSNDRMLGEANGLAHRWLLCHLTTAICAQQLGTVEGALALTAEYSKTREQFGRPIGTFQAVSQRLADGYIDNLGARLTLWQAVWALSEGHHGDEAVAVAKLWAADAGHKLAHTTVHVHGGVGIDLDGEAHRFFTAAKRNEFLMGGATEQARFIGEILAS